MAMVAMGLVTAGSGEGRRGELPRAGMGSKETVSAVAPVALAVPVVLVSEAVNLDREAGNEEVHGMAASRVGRAR